MELLVSLISLFLNEFLQLSLLLEVNVYNLSSQQKAIKNSSSVIYPPKRLVIIYHLWGEGGCERILVESQQSLHSPP